MTHKLKPVTDSLVTGIAAERFAVEAARIAAEDKCEEVLILDLRQKCSVADFFVIATGTSDRQMAAVGDHINEFAHKTNKRAFTIARLNSPNWVLLDYVDVIVHIFDQEHREYYDLELLWGDAPRVEWNCQSEEKE